MQQQAGATNQLLQGAGGQAAQSAVQLNNALNPTQAANNQQAQSLANAYNLGGLSPGQGNAAERSLNQTNYGTGNLGNMNGTNTISNAMNFGNAYNQEVSNAANALNASNSVAQSQNSQVNPYSVAIGAGNTNNNFGLNNMSTTQANANLTLPYSAASSLGNQLAGIGAASKGSTASQSGSANGGISCFLTTAACEFMGLPDDCLELETLRQFRDEHVPKSLVDEYYQIAPAICQKLNKDQLAYVWVTVQQCVQHIKLKQFPEAINLYKEMVEELK